MENNRKVIIRKYEPRDRKAVRHICCETGAMGQPMERFQMGRTWFADRWSAYYTDYEPESCWVSEVDGVVMGYILGCLDTKRQQKIQAEVIAPRIARKYKWLGFFLHPKNRLLDKRIERSNQRGEWNSLQNLADEYPAHLHTNLLAGYRGLGIGKQLMNAYMEYLYEKKLAGLHLGTSSYNKLAVPFYEKMGFKLMAKAKCTMYEGLIDEWDDFYVLQFAKMI